MCVGTFALRRHQSVLPDQQIFTCRPGTLSAHGKLARPRRFERPTFAAGAFRSLQSSKIWPVADKAGLVYAMRQAPVAQLDRALPSEGKGRTFESSRARQ